MRPNAEYIANRTILVNSVRAYNPGDDVFASAVENLGLTVGVDVLPANPNVIPRPAANARRADWVAYWVGQGMPQDQVDEMTRDQLAAREPEVIGSPDLDANLTVPAVPNPTPSPAPDTVAFQVAEQSGQAAEQQAAERVERPGQGARKAEWVEYAVYRGMARETAEESTIPQLAACDYDNLFGPERPE
ncbi:hypothetical protein D7193_15290 [Micromonospora costi]|uniref:Uncharacterized protein n=2 Tax=Micromonospora costi TaxID=1530042 RepID=A0A3B0A5B6_9ACTN|nr:hypothetical protein D7193_15290 [Micromonospora costi]